MDNNLINFGIGGLLALVIIKELFVFLKGIISPKQDPGLIAISKTLDNSTLMLELIQERMRNHEQNAHYRHVEVVTKVDTHGAECRAQAIRIQEATKARG